MKKLMKNLKERWEYGDRMLLILNLLLILSIILVVVTVIVGTIAIFNSSEQITSNNFNSALVVQQTLRIMKMF